MKSNVDRRVVMAALAALVAACGSDNAAGPMGSGGMAGSASGGASGVADSSAAGASSSTGTMTPADAAGAGGTNAGGGGTGGQGGATSTGGSTESDASSGAAGVLSGSGGTNDGGTGNPNDAASSLDAKAPTDASATGSIVTTVDIADVWSGHPVGFALVTHENQQFAAFYDTNRQLTVAQRTLDSTTWKFARVATTVGWDSHNYIAMAIDSGGFIHISGNMHAEPLIYFRTTAALDIGTFQRVTSMVGRNEQSCTYPQFVHRAGGELVYIYRDGVSGNGDHLFNVYDVATKTWKRLNNTPLTDGQGQRNAYPVGPSLGPDGYWHFVYTWRESSDASTNHDLSYARSKDLTTWESATGKTLTLPITLATSDIVDPVPQKGGMINNNTKVGFDSQNRAIVGYHKYDAAGNTQLYNARIEGGRWVTHQASDWKYRWSFGGMGSLVFQILLDGVKVEGGGLIQNWYHSQYGGWNAFRLDENTLASTATTAPSLPYPASLDKPESKTADMGVRWATDTGSGPDKTVLYMLRWETLPENQDQPRSTIPPATRLRLYGFRQ